jgi:hypothetical protein
MEQLEYWQAIEDGAAFEEETKKKKKKKKKSKKKLKEEAEKQPVPADVVKSKDSSKNKAEVE